MAPHRNRIGIGTGHQQEILRQSIGRATGKQAGKQAGKRPKRPGKRLRNDWAATRRLGKQPPGKRAQDSARPSGYRARTGQQVGGWPPYKRQPVSDGRASEHRARDHWAC